MGLNDNSDCQSFNLEQDVELKELLLKKEYSLNSVNNYGDSLLHVSAAHGYTESVRTMLIQSKNSTNVDRKNKFGWTPLMHAIRGNNIATVKVLLENGSDVTQRTYLGTSALTLATGMGKEMFETIYRARPSMLENSVHDDITPLCVAAMKNDKDLFFRLLELGLDVKHESLYTHLVMRQSVFPEIQDLAELHSDIQDYWSDESDNIRTVDNESCIKDASCDGLPSPVMKESKKNTLPLIMVDSPGQEAASSNHEMDKKTKLPNLDLLCLKEACFKESQSISPNLNYNLDSWFTESPNPSCSLTNNFPYGPKPPIPLSGDESGDKLCRQKLKTQHNIFVFDKILENISIRDAPSSQPTIENCSTDKNTSLTFVPEFSPSRSPYLPSDFEDEDVCGEDTPTPPHYKTPPQGMVFNSEQAKLVIMLKQFDLAHLASKFLMEEVDMNLFLTLNDQDLTEIGITNEEDRKALLAVIDAYTKYEK